MFALFKGFLFFQFFVIFLCSPIKFRFFIPSSEGE